MTNRSLPTTHSPEKPIHGNQQENLQHHSRPDRRAAGVDVSALVEWQRKDLEALAEANRQAYEGMKALAQRQAEILRENLSEWQGAMQGAVSPDALAKQSDAAKRGVQQAIDNFREIAAMETETRTNAWKVVQDRMQENMANLQKLMQGKK